MYSSLKLKEGSVKEKVIVIVVIACIFGIAFADFRPKATCIYNNSIKNTIQGLGSSNYDASYQNCDMQSLSNNPSNQNNNLESTSNNSITNTPQGNISNPSSNSSNPNTNTTTASSENITIQVYPRVVQGARTTVSGKATKSDGSVIANAIVSVTDSLSGSKVTGTTDSNGLYSVVWTSPDNPHQSDTLIASMDSMNATANVKIEEGGKFSYVISGEIRMYDQKTRIVTDLGNPCGNNSSCVRTTIFDPSLSTVLAGTTNGVYFYDFSSNKWSYLPNGNNVGEVMTMAYISSTNQVAVGTWGGGVRLYDHSTQTWKYIGSPTAPIYGSLISELSYDGTNDLLYASSYSGYVSYWDMKKGTWTSVASYPTSDNTNAYVYLTTDTSSGKLYMFAGSPKTLSNESYHVISFNPITKTTIDYGQMPNISDIPDGFVYNSETNLVYIGTNTGMETLSPLSGVFQYKGSFPSGTYGLQFLPINGEMLAEDIQGNAYAGYEGSVTGTWFSWNNSGLPSRTNSNIGGPLFSITN